MTFRGTVPSPRSNHVAALYEDKTLLIFGGATKSRTLNDLFSLDFETVCKNLLLYFLSHAMIIQFHVDILIQLLGFLYR